MSEKNNIYGDYANFSQISNDEQHFFVPPHIFYHSIENNECDSYFNPILNQANQDASTSITGNIQYLNIKTKRGRKNKGSKENRNHSKINDDNMILKIKNNFSNSIVDLLNNSFIYRGPEILDGNPHTNKFLKINGQINKKIKKDNNINMLNTKIKDFLSENVSPKFQKAEKDHNKKLIEKIQEQNKEVKILSILELTYKDMLDIFNGNISDELKLKIKDIKIFDNFSKLEDFLEKMRKKEEDEGMPDEFINKYIEKMRRLCKGFEEWFNAKLGRNKKK